MVRKYATFTLGALAAPRKEGDPPTLPQAREPLTSKLTDPRPEVQWNAAFALAFYLRDGSGAAVVRRMLDRQHVSEIVNASQREPGVVGDQRAAAPALIAHVLQMGCQAVAALGDLSFKDQILVLAKDDDHAVRDAAQKTLKYLEGKK